MLRSQLLLNTAEMLEKETGHNLDNFRTAFEALHGPKPERVLGGSDELTDWLNKYNPYYKLCEVGGYTDAAMLLGKGLPWLVPELNYAYRTARLLNGVGLPVGGLDYPSRAETMPLSLAASWLKAHAHQATYTESKDAVGDSV
jgi:hypothetical protein